MDTAVAPRRVLAREADDVPTGFGGGGWPAGPVRVGPVVRDEASMPAKDRVGLHQEHRPPVAAEHARQRGEDRPVGGFETRSRHLTVQDRELMAQDEDLGVLRTIGAAA